MGTDGFYREIIMRKRVMLPGDAVEGNRRFNPKIEMWPAHKIKRAKNNVRTHSNGDRV